jgi:adenosylcobinamide-GDP ribazoletransferase
MSARRELDSLLGAIRFFTRLKVPGRHDDVALERAIRYFPAVGLLVGAIAALVFVAASLVWPKTLALITAISAAVVVTGAIHEDGWSDMVDGFGGGASREKVLAIMRDSALGSFGALALTMLIVARFFALLEIGATLLPIALIAGHAVSRLCATFVLGALDYARSEGKAKPFANRLGRGELVFATLCALAPLVFLPLQPALAGLLLALIATLWLARLFKRRIGGYTGDCLGATQQLSELAFYGGLLCRFS